MSFLGMGTMEILIIGLVAFIFLGPERMVDAARLLGRAVREARRMTADLPELVLDADDTDPVDAPTVQPGRGRHTEGADKEVQAPSAPQSDEASADGDGPVAFRPAATARPQDDTESTPPQER